MDFVDEQDDIATRLDFLEHFLQALFEITAIPGAGDHGSEIQRIHLLVFEGFRNIARDDLLGEAFDDGGLTDAGLTDQHRIVLGAAGQHDHDAFDFLGTPDHRVKLAGGGFSGQIAAELVKNR